MKFNQTQMWQKLVLFTSLLPPLATFLCFGLGTSFEEATATSYSRTLIEPAGYAFIIWSLIYLGGIAYGIYQFRAKQKDNLLLQRISLPVASAFTGTSVWLLMARFNLQLGTVVCIYWIFFSLLIVFLELANNNRAFSRTEKWLVYFPFSIFFGWLSVAIFANSASALKTSGWRYFLQNEERFTLVFLALSLCFAAFMLKRSRGNIPYSFTIIWALIAIAVANRMNGQSEIVALTAGVGVLLVGLFLFVVRSRASHMKQAI